MTVYLFEGPETGPETRYALKGWRHYQMRCGGKTTSFVSRPGAVLVTVKALHAEFFPAGTWEAGALVARGSSFPVPRSEILERLSGRHVQTEAAI